MKRIPLLIFGIVLILALVWKVLTNERAPELQLVQGTTMGTIVYNVKYLGSSEDFKADIDRTLNAFNQSLSTYIPQSEISILNQQGKIEFNSDYFLPVLKESKRVFELTNGAFDPTVGPLINAWGFGPSMGNEVLDSTSVDSLLTLVGYQDVTFDDQSVSMPEGYKLDFSAIAKGYAVDLVGSFLENKGITNYMVEIGGELRCRGVNKEGESWSIGIEDPSVNIDEKALLSIVKMKDQSLATSGNYRNYFVEDGKLFAHIIDPRTGYTSNHNLLSASVFSANCMTADAFATAFMVLGLNKAIEVVAKEVGLEAIFIYQAEAGLKTYVSDGIAPFVTLDKTK